MRVQHNNNPQIMNLGMYNTKKKEMIFYLFSINLNHHPH